MKYTFEVLGVSTRSSFVIAQLCDQEFVPNNEQLLDGLPILSVDIPRAVDEHGDQRPGVWAFWLERIAIEEFEVGQIVTVT